MPTGHPSVCSVTSAADSGARATCWLEKIEPGALGVERKVAHTELEHVALGSEPRQVGLLRATGGDELRSPWNPGHHDPEHVVADGRLQLVEVVEHEHERRRTGCDGSGQAGRGAPEHREAQAAHVGDQLSVARPHPRVRRWPATESNAAGSSSKRSSDTHATGRSSDAAHSARSDDLP